MYYKIKEMDNITEIKGDLIELAKEGGHFNTIIHGANCFSTMGSGIAKQVKDNFPNAYTVDTKDPRSPLQRLGDFSWEIEKSSDGDSLTVINLYQQFEPGKNLSYAALRLGLRKVNMIFKNHHIGIPKNMGCGIAGGVWGIVFNIIKDELRDCKVTIVNWNKNEK